MDSVNCDLCGGDSNIHFASQKDLLHKQTNEIFHVVKCNNCGLVFTNPRPSINEIKKYYPVSYYAHEKRILNHYFIKKIKEFIVNSFILKIISYIPVVSSKFRFSVLPKVKSPIIKKKDMTFLDIGCGNGEIVHIWGVEHSIKRYSKMSDNIYAIEPDEIAHKQLKNICNAYKYLEEIPKEINFDVIRMNWSLEHVHYPSAHFKFIRERLNQNGYAVICVPNLDGEIYKIDNSLLELPVHLYHFTKSTIDKYCKKYDLKINESYTFSYASMYFFASKISNKLKSYCTYSLRDLIKLQKKLDNETDKYYGNDLVCIIKRNSD